MADDKKDATNKERKDAKPAAEAVPAAHPGGGLPIGAIAAGAILLLIGSGMGVGGAMVMAKWAGGTEAKPTEAAAQAAKTADDEHGKGKSRSLHDMTEITIGDLMSNIRNQQGRRFVKVSCAIYMVTADAMKLGLAGGGGHGGGEGGGNVKRILQQALEEHLKNYDMDELTGANIYSQLNKGFRESIERALHEIFHDEPSDKRFVERVVLTNLLVQ